jgi:hypothetical protein
LLSLVAAQVHILEAAVVVLVGFFREQLRPH